MCYPTWSWSSTHATRHHSACHTTSIINQVWRARSISTAHVIVCCSTFSNNRWTILVIHRASSCWAPLHAAPLTTIVMQRSLWRFRAIARLSSSFAYLHNTPGPCLWFFQSKGKWNQALKTQKHNFIFNYHYDMHKSNLEVNISAGNVAVSNVRVMLNANWVGVVFA
jgi:hypothetical protein